MIERENKIITVLPLLLIEVYLILSLLLLKFGPIEWNIKNEKLFWILLIAYHIMFIIGYLVSMNKIDVYEYKFEYKSKINTNFSKLFWFFLILAMAGSIIGYRNLVHSDSYIPYHFFQDFLKGLIHPGERYYYKLSKEASENFTGNYFVTMILAAIAFAKFSLIPVLVFLWRKISVPQKICGLLIVFISFAAGITVGTNKPLFDILFLFAGALLIELVIVFKKERFDTLKTRKTIIAIIIFLIVFCPSYFKYSVNDRVGTVSYVETIAMEGDIILKNRQNRYVGYPGEELLIWITIYVDQGYYGMALALDKSFDSTYGLGSSYFVINSMKKFFNIDISTRTYQHKITRQWNEFGQWHSFYSQIANDVSFYGVALVMFLIGMFLALVWKDALKTDNIIGKCILLLFVIMFLYMPANNQVFNIMESLFAFIELTILWVILYITNLKSIKNNQENIINITDLDMYTIK